jgi:hypothetical protein
MTDLTHCEIAYFNGSWRTLPPPIDIENASVFQNAPWRPFMYPCRNRVAPVRGPSRALGVFPMDLTDPEIWKTPATLVEYWKTIFGGGLAILAVLATIFRKALPPLRWVSSKLGGLRRQPRVALSFVQEDRMTTWSAARLNNQDGTHVRGVWHVTNTSERNVAVLKARIRKYQTPYAQVFTERADGNTFGRNAIPAHRMTELVADFSFFPPIGRGREALVADVIFTDNYGDEHRVRANFLYIGPDKPI